MIPDRQPCALFAADDNFVLLDQLAQILEAHRSFVQLHAMMFGQRVDQVGRRNGLAYAVFPPSAFHQIIEQDGDDVIGLDERTVFIHDAEAIGISVGRDAKPGAGAFHGGTKVVEQRIVRLRRMAAEQHVASVVDCGDWNTEVAQQSVGIVASRTPERIKHDPHSRLAYQGKVTISFRRAKYAGRGSTSLGLVRAARTPRCPSSGMSLSMAWVTSGSAGAPS